MICMCLNRNRTIDVVFHLPTHRLLLNSTLCSLTAFSCASSSVCSTQLAPFLPTNRICRMASSMDMPRTKQAMNHIFSGLYLKFVIWWQTNWNQKCIAINKIELKRQGKRCVCVWILPLAEAPLPPSVVDRFCHCISGNPLARLCSALHWCANSNWPRNCWKAMQSVRTLSQFHGKSTTFSAFVTDVRLCGVLTVKERKE